MVPAYSHDNTAWFTDTLSLGAKHEIKPWQGKHDDTILLQYTGGTTGVSKGAMLTNENLIANMLQIRAVMEPYFKDIKDRVALSPLPLYHIFAFSVNCLALMGVGFKNVLVTNPRDLPSVIKEFKAHKINLMTGINTLFNALINHPDFAKQDFSHLRVTSGGGMAVQRAVAEKWQQITGSELAEGYGMTESSPVLTTNPVVNGRIGTIGIPVPSTDVRIVDDNGVPIPVGEVGEIQARGPQIMKGYYNQPEATAEIIKDAWLGTGDMGLMSEDGYFRIVDRKKDMILVSGFNVYPNEIEDVIAMHPKVLEVAAIGVKDEKAGEVPKVFIVRKDFSLTQEEIITFCRTNLTAYKIPRYVEFRSELPKSNVGKILRKELRES
jgi:long-chain acyl-CoA synthetase